MSDTPLTDVCFEAAQVLIRKYGTRDGVGPEFNNGNPWLLARRLERNLAVAEKENAELRAKLNEAYERAASACLAVANHMNENGRWNKDYQRGIGRCAEVIRTVDLHLTQN